MSCYGEVRRGGDRKRDRQETRQLTTVIEAIPRSPPQRVLRAAVIPRGGPGRASLNFHIKRDTTLQAFAAHSPSATSARPAVSDAGDWPPFRSEARSGPSGVLRDLRTRPSE